ncbi:c-type cytochrome [Trinickia dinghuensis]|uniref:Cytochrome C n=1 Tax=Trinickia dinghuensis TaxID=2291023 RepID=A0A3D8K3Q6_9BURK|nr:c-type cytochrome [Trinickia dinghuensis]RDU99526.1 cytochrome C [Trinickia dinghuensis]
MRSYFALCAGAAAVTFALVSQGVAAADADSVPPSSLGATIATQGTAKGIPACASCHGAHGEGQPASGFPRLAGLGEAYFTAQLAAFADGSRPSPVMQPFAKMMSSGERAAVAEYFSSLPPPDGIRNSDTADPLTSDLGAWLATRGRWQQGLPACVQCHGSGGAGVGSVFPPLAGQPASYIEAQLHAWKDGKRAPGPMALMPTVAGKLSDADIDAVAAYYAEQAPASNASK